ncbi:unnamed protein product [Calicophoron daubneyi]|uniref:Uncharacterized protein n=1 Tax=Calicophoron daubneyi TaxID=300641 RepID=A0AAV2T3F8_CALDB
MHPGSDLRNSARIDCHCKCYCHFSHGEPPDISAIQRCLSLLSRPSRQNLCTMEEKLPSGEKPHSTLPMCFCELYRPDDKKVSREPAKIPADLFDPNHLFMRFLNEQIGRRMETGQNQMPKQEKFPPNEYDLMPQPKSVMKTKEMEEPQRSCKTAWCPRERLARPRSSPYICSMESEGLFRATYIYHPERSEDGRNEGTYEIFQPFKQYKAPTAEKISKNKYVFGQPSFSHRSSSAFDSRRSRLSSSSKQKSRSTKSSISSARSSKRGKKKASSTLNEESTISFRSNENPVPELIEVYDESNAYDSVSALDDMPKPLDVAATVGEPDHQTTHSVSTAQEGVSLKVIGGKSGEFSSPTSSPPTSLKGETNRIPQLFVRYGCFIFEHRPWPTGGKTENSVR